MCRRLTRSDVLSAGNRRLQRKPSTCRSIVCSYYNKERGEHIRSPRSLSMMDWNALPRRYPQLRNAIISSATMLTILIIGLIAGPAVSL